MTALFPRLLRSIHKLIPVLFTVLLMITLVNLASAFVPSPEDLPEEKVPQPVSVTKQDTLLVDADGSGDASPGDTLQYTVVVSNVSGLDLTNVLITDTVDANTTLTGLVNSTPLAFDDAYTTTVNAQLSVDAASGLLQGAASVYGPDIDPDGGSVTAVPFSGSSVLGGGVEILTTGAFTYTPPANSGGEDFFTYTIVDEENTTDSATVTVSLSGLDIAVSKVVSDPAPDEGDTIVYTVAATNNGPDNATSVVISDTLPAGVTYVDDDRGDYIAPLWNIGTLGDGVSETLHITATVDTGTAGSFITNEAELTHVDQVDYEPGNNSASAQIAVNAVDIAVSKTVDSTTPNENDTVVYTIAVTNNGPGNATGVVISDTLPAGVTYVDDDRGDYIAPLWNIGALGNGVTETLHITATVDAGTAGSIITNEAELTHVDQVDYEPGNNSASAQIAVNAADIAVSKTVDSATPNENDTVVYTVMATNNGPNDASGLVISDTLPAGVTYIDDDSPSYTEPTWNIGGLNSGASVTLNITVTVDPGTAGTTITNTAELAALDQADPVTGNDSDNASINVPLVDVEVTKSVDNSTPGENDTIVYTVVAANNGPDNASSVVVSDTLPAGVSYVSDDRNGDYVQPSWNIGSLNNGASATLNITVTVDPGTAGSTITNTASLAAVDQKDSDPSNDSIDAPIHVPLVDIEVAKTVDNSLPGQGTTILYTVVATNNGPDDASGLVISDTLPAGVTHVSDDSGGDYNAPAWEIGALNNGTNITLNITATVDTGTIGKTITNTATVTAVDGTDSDSTNDSDDATITVVNAPPTTGVNNYNNVIGNTLFGVGVNPPGPVVAVTGSVLDNASDGGDGPGTLSVVATQNPSDQDGIVSMNANGTFTYTPPVGVSGSDTFTYTISDGLDTADGTVNLTISEMVWYIDNTAGGGGDGRSTSPFNSLASVNGAGGAGDDDEPGDIIFVYQGSGNYTGGIELENNQNLTGQGVDLVVSGNILVTASGKPAITNSGGAGINLTGNNTIRGLDVSGTSGAGVTGNSVGNLVVSGGVAVINAGGPAVDIATGSALSVTFTSLSSSGSSAEGIDLDNVGGAFNVTGVTTINNTTGDGIDITSSSATFTFASIDIDNTGGNGIDLVNVSGSFSANGGDITGAAGVAFNVGNGAASSGGSGNTTYAGSINNSTGRSVSIQDRTGGTVTLSGTINDTSSGIFADDNSGGTINLSGGTKTLNTGTASAVTLSDNTGSTINFTNGGLDIDTTSGAGFVATGGGAVNVTTGANANTINTTTGTAINVANTNIGSNDLTFKSVSAGASTNSAGTGLILDNTGTSGGLTITGDGSTAASGGTIQHKNGGNGTNNGIGILLNNTQDVSLSYMQLNNFTNFAIRGTTVTAFTMTNTTINGGNGTSAAHDEGSVSFDDLLGSANFTNNSISGGLKDNIVVTNDTGTLDRMNVSGGTIGLNSTTLGNDGILVEAQSSAVINLTVSGVAFSGARGDLVQANAIGNSTMDVVLRDNNFQNNHTNIVSGGGGITISGGSGGGNINMTYLIEGSTPGGQTFRDAEGNAITVNFVSGAGTANGIIRNNAIGVSGVSGSGSSGGSGISVGASQNVNHIVAIDDNTIREVAGFGGIDITANTDVNFDATITGNDITLSSSGFALAGLSALVGGAGTETGTACLDIQNNTFDASSAPFAISETYFDQISASANFNLPGYTGSPNGEFFAGSASTDIGAYLPGKGNTFVLSPVADAFFVSGVTGSGTACTTPTLASASQSLAHNQTNRPKSTTLAKPADAILQASNHAGTDISLNIPVLPPGKSVTITFEVLVVDPFPEGVDAVSNQAFVSADGLPPVPSDDPDTPNPDDPTVTPISTEPPISRERFIFLPTIFKNVVNLPDLVVTDISTSGDNVQLIIENQGSASVMDEFWVDVYFDPDSPPTSVNQTIETLGVEGLVWGVTDSALPIDPGETLTLTIGDLYYNAAVSDFDGVIPAGTELYAQVDSANTTTDYGAVLENHEATNSLYNNITGPVTAPTTLNFTGLSELVGALPQGSEMVKRP